MIKKSTVLWLSGLMGFLLIQAPGVQADLTQKIMGEWKGNGTQYSAKGELIQVRKYTPDPKTSPPAIPFHGPR